MKLQWENVKGLSGHGYVCTLWNMDGSRFVERLGTLSREKDGYAIFPTNSMGATYLSEALRLPADLTLDEAKSAAKLILATGRTS
jgi:hypothetical protein